MLKGQGASASKQQTNATCVMVGPSEAALLEPVEKAKKKLSFREPEIIGYYMQMKQGVTNRLSRRGKSKNGSKSPVATTAKSCIFKNSVSDDKDINYNHLGGSTEDLSLEVLSKIWLFGSRFWPPPPPIRLRSFASQSSIAATPAWKAAASCASEMCHCILLWYLQIPAPVPYQLQAPSVNQTLQTGTWQGRW